MASDGKPAFRCDDCSYMVRLGRRAAGSASTDKSAYRASQSAVFGIQIHRRAAHQHEVRHRFPTTVAELERMTAATVQLLAVRNNKDYHGFELDQHQGNKIVCTLGCRELPFKTVITMEQVRKAQRRSRTLLEMITKRLRHHAMSGRHKLAVAMFKQQNNS